MNKTLKFIDLFCGIGGLRLGFENACNQLKIKPICVFASEIKSTAIQVYQTNFNNEKVSGDIAQIDSNKIPDFDVLLAGFPCQSFSTAGVRKGLGDARGVLFYEIERILKEKQPGGFLLENVPNLLKHNRGNTWQIISKKLSELGYKISYCILNSKHFGLPQDRARIYLVGTLTKQVHLDNFPESHCFLKDILEQGLPTLKTKLTQKLLEIYQIDELYGRAIKDKRGGNNNIHSWDLEIKGKITVEQKKLLNSLLKERRKKIWAEKKGIKWMDGMPLTLTEIASFYNNDLQNLQKLLDDLVEKKYLKYEHPKDEFIRENVKTRLPRMDLPKGYNIVTGKLSFEINKILDPDGIAPTLVATDMERIAVIDGKGIRKLSNREGLRLFGFPEDFQLNIAPKKAFDLLGNTVPVPVVKQVALRLVKTVLELKSIQQKKSFAM
ncbi:MAG: DNA (cytosine-5-)-methyltransferase [Gomphosphaeria aponina SAG 52.96 = DSM 107014]|uniref:Cytosine-specific methyltransferase n=1 Tax=Gomphosphaeria aponina SAG 52.96 = DSM 107014 TaxID=1521640 RepID=A0A941JMP5_9CHRO|nr:DNA (cytosine-5-)-methyltransferase [Gomphosphaeria aponina SAG 52.96 = DSM 107014]